MPTILSGPAGVLLSVKILLQCIRRKIDLLKQTAILAAAPPSQKGSLGFPFDAILF